MEWKLHRATRRAWLFRGVTLALACLSACSTATAPITDAVEASAPYLSTFARLERWATRLSSSDVRLRGRSALSEATFAPFRADNTVLWADVRVAEQHLQYEQPVASETLHYVTIDAPGVGRVWVALVDECQAPVRPARQLRGSSAGAQTQLRACVVIARPAAGARAASFRVAFTRLSPAPETKPPALNAPKNLEVSERGNVGPHAKHKALVAKH